MKTNGKTFADEGTTEEEARADYRRIAERRVRLGLVLAQIGEKADIKVSDDEVTQALVERVRQYPGQEKQVWEFYRKNPQALAEIRAPLFEEKVVDHILSAGEGGRGDGLQGGAVRRRGGRGGRLGAGGSRSGQGRGRRVARVSSRLALASNTSAVQPRGRFQEPVRR